MLRRELTGARRASTHWRLHGIGPVAAAKMKRLGIWTGIRLAGVTVSTVEAATCAAAANLPLFVAEDLTEATSV